MSGQATAHQSSTPHHGPTSNNNGGGTIRFVMEGPQNAKTRQKKRARLVTACDECRIRKVKCHQPSPNQPCEACKTSQVKCLFGDRDRYHAERGSLSEGNTSTSSSGRSSKLPSRRGSLIDGGGGRNMKVNTNGIGGGVSSTTSSPLSTHSSLASANGNGYAGVDVNAWMDQTVTMSSRSRSQSLSESTGTNSSNSPIPSSLIDPSLQYHSHSHTLSSQQYDISPPHSNTSNSSNSPPNQHLTSVAPPPPNPVTHAHATHLFDPLNPDIPHPEILSHLVEIFFTRLGSQFPFIKKFSIINSMNMGRLDGHLANGICALAARFSEWKEVVPVGSPKWSAGEPFLHKAKLAVIPLISYPTLSALHTLVLIAWAEYGSARDSGLFNFARMAASMCVDLGMANRAFYDEGKEGGDDMSDEEREMMRATWAGVVRVDLTSAWVTGRSSSLQGAQLQTSLSPSSPISVDPFDLNADLDELTSRSPPRSSSSTPSASSSASSSTGDSEGGESVADTKLLLDRLTKLYTIRDEVTKMMNSDGVKDGETDERPVQNMLLSIQSSLQKFYKSLTSSSSLTFTSENFKKFDQAGYGSVFLLLHLMYHGSNTLVNWPSLFKEFTRPMPHSVSVSCASARSLVSALRIAYTIDRQTLLANPFFDVPISVAARAFLAQRSNTDNSGKESGSTSANGGKGGRGIDNSWLESNLGTCMDVLANMAQYWGGADIVGELLEQRGAKFHRRSASFSSASSSSSVSTTSSTAPNSIARPSIPLPISSLPLPSISSPVMTSAAASTSSSASNTATTASTSGVGSFPSRPSLLVKRGSHTSQELHIPLSSLSTSSMNPTPSGITSGVGSAPPHMSLTRQFTSISGLPGMGTMSPIPMGSSMGGMSGIGGLGDGMGMGIGMGMEIDSPMATPRQENILGVGMSSMHVGGGVSGGTLSSLLSGPATVLGLENTNHAHSHAHHSQSHHGHHHQHQQQQQRESEDVFASFFQRQNQSNSSLNSTGSGTIDNLNGTHTSSSSTSGTTGGELYDTNNSYGGLLNDGNVLYPPPPHHSHHRHHAPSHW